CFNAFTGEFFTLHVHLLSWSGDLSALSKIMCTTGHNSYLGCHFCYIQGMTANHHVYYPLESLNSITRTRYDSKELSLQTHQSYIQTSMQLWLPGVLHMIRSGETAVLDTES